MTKQELIDKAICWFKVIVDDMGCITTGNLSHRVATTKGRAIRATEFLEKHKNDEAKEGLVDIEKVCEWLTQNFLNYMKYHHDGKKVYYTYNNEKLIDDLKKAMEE